MTMDDIAFQRLSQDLVRRIGQSEVKEVPGIAGVYDPTYLGLATPGTTTYVGQDGSYYRIGNLIIVMGRVVWSNATGTGAAIVSLPVPAVFTRVSRFPVYLYPINVTFANGSVVGAIDSGTSANGFVMNSPATNAAGTILPVEVAGDLTFACAYEWN